MYRVITILIGIIAVVGLLLSPQPTRAGGFTLFNFGGGNAAARRAYNRGYAAAKRGGGSGGALVQYRAVAPMAYGAGSTGGAGGYSAGGSTGGMGGYTVSGFNGGAGGYTQTYGAGSNGGDGGVPVSQGYVQRATVYRATKGTTYGATGY